jgi:hypothetical protein
VRRVAAFAGTAVVAGWAAAAGAEPAPRADLFAGYSAVRSDDDTLHGGEIALGFRIAGPLSIVGDLDFHGHTVDSVGHHTGAALAGPRLSFGAGLARPFIHALLGAVRDSDSVAIFSQTISESHTVAGAAAGGGLDLGRGRFAVRIQADYRLARRKDEAGATMTQGDPRLSAGGVLRFGRP